MARHFGNAPPALAMDARIGLFKDISLARGELHAWFVRLEDVRRHVDSLVKILTPNEIARADRFFFENDRIEYILARGLLRHIVSRYVGFAPDQLRFGYNSHGKPALEDEWRGDQLEFNLSHARGWVVYALTKARCVGVDLEYTDRSIEIDQIAERFFSPYEASLFQQLPGQEKKRAFFSCWTRKEAYVKARGEGLSLDLRGFDVTIAPDQPALLLRVAGDPSEARRWSLTDLPAPAGYAAALAMEGRIDEIQLWQWPERSHGRADDTSTWFNQRLSCEEIPDEAL